jgi:hypothetical protein
MTAGLVAIVGEGLAPGAQVPKDAPTAGGKDSLAAELTRTKLLKVKVTVAYTDTRVGEILKEFAHLVDTKADQPVMWAYGENFPFDKKITFSIKDKPLDAALDQFLTKIGGGTGYVVVSKDGDKYDGWVRLTTTGERGSEAPAASAEDEAAAAARLALAKKLIDAGKPSAAKPVLEIIAKNYPTTKAGAEAKELLAKMDK